MDVTSRCKGPVAGVGIGRHMDHRRQGRLRTGELALLFPLKRRAVL